MDQGRKQHPNSRKDSYPELTGEVAMVGAPLDTTRADRRCGCTCGSERSAEALPQVTG